MEQNQIQGLFKTEQSEEISRKDLTLIFQGLFKGITLEEFAFTLTNKYSSAIEYAQLVNGERVNTQMTILFNPHRLSTTTLTSKFSLFDAISNHTDEYMSGLARVALHKGILSKRGLLNIIELGFNGITYVQDFLAYVARDVYKKYGITKTSKILDPCAGWGGRMIGASVVCDAYHCFEPATKTYRGLKRLSKFIKSMNADFSAEIHNLPFEESELEDEYYDVALTSPPYYNTEHYSDEETNSLNRYKTFDDWCEGFYYPLIEKTMDALKPTGVFILNIGDRKYPLSEKMNERFSDVYKIKRLKNYISNSKAGGKVADKGEQFYEISKL